MMAHNKMIGVKNNSSNSISHIYWLIRINMKEHLCKHMVVIINMFKMSLAIFYYKFFANYLWIIRKIIFENLIVPSKSKMAIPLCSITIVSVDEYGGFVYILLQLFMFFVHISVMTSTKYRLKFNKYKAIILKKFVNKIINHYEMVLHTWQINNFHKIKEQIAKKKDSV